MRDMERKRAYSRRRYRDLALNERLPIVCKLRNRRWRRDHPEEYAELKAMTDAAARERDKVHKRRYAKLYESRRSPASKRRQAAWKATRKRRTRRATPPWPGLRRQLVVFYAGRRGRSVDHIIPLSHPLVCGLNVPANLQYLTLSANMAKSNAFNQEAWAI